MNQPLYNKYLSVLSTLLIISLVFSLLGLHVVKADENILVDNSTLSSEEFENPAKDAVLPALEQYRYHKEEMSAFVHFGPNTFNEIEWGEHYGARTPASIFPLTQDFDADTIVKTLRDAGFKRMVVTAKHHDGFCIWPSAYTDYDVASTNYKEGQGDILGELSAAANKYNIDMGLYLSPWDIHEPSYGYYDEHHNPLPRNRRGEDALDYNDYYANQLEEILSNPKYGHNGRFVEIWMDGAKGSGANAQDYDFERFIRVMFKYQGTLEGRYDANPGLFGAGKYTTIRWIGNENGFAADPNWAKARKSDTGIDVHTDGHYTTGYKDGNIWSVPECDARITSGWFWGRNKAEPKSLATLADMYFNSVGRGGVLLLNIPPNNRGTLDDKIRERTLELGRVIQESFRTNLVATAQATEVRGQTSKFSPMNLLDKNHDSIWTLNDGSTTGSVVLDLGANKKFDNISIEEAIQYGQRIDRFKVEYQKPNQQWETIFTGESIGSKRLLRFLPVTARKVKITVSSMNDQPPVLSEAGVYKLAEEFEIPQVYPSDMKFIDITKVNQTSDTFYDVSSSWNDEAGSQFVNTTSKWAGANATMKLKFTGTLFQLFGTLDPGHGIMEIRIDGGSPLEVNTGASDVRKTGQLLYTSEDLADGEHIIEIRVKTRFLGLDGAAVVDNGGYGLVEFAESSLDMHEDDRQEITVVRKGGTDKEVTVTVAPNPGTAIQEDYDTENIQRITFQAGETEKRVSVITKRNTKRTGRIQFSLALEKNTDQVILGKKDTMRINIIDKEQESFDLLRQAVEEGENLNSSIYISGYVPYRNKVAEGRDLLDFQEGDADMARSIYDEIMSLKQQLIKRSTAYSDDDRFVFPNDPNLLYGLEAEFSILNNYAAQSNERWKLTVEDGTWASEGKFINSLNDRDTITIPYRAEKTGTYIVKAYYRSGSNSNALQYAEESNKIVAGTQSAGSDNASIVRTKEFEMVVREAGEGRLVFTGPPEGSPQLDKLEFRLKGVSVRTRLQPDFTARLSKAKDFKAISGEAYTQEIRPVGQYFVQRIRLDHENYPLDLQSKEQVVHLEAVTEAHTIEVDLALAADMTAVLEKMQKVKNMTELLSYTEESKAEAHTRLEELAKQVKSTKYHTQAEVEEFMAELTAIESVMQLKALQIMKEIDSHMPGLPALDLDKIQASPQLKAGTGSETSSLNLFEAYKGQVLDIRVVPISEEEMKESEVMEMAQDILLNEGEGKELGDPLVYQIRLMRGEEELQPVEGSEFLLTLPLSESLKTDAKKGSLLIIHYHGDHVDRLTDYEYQEEENTVTLRLEHFSKLAFYRLVDKKDKMHMTELTSAHLSVSPAKEKYYDLKIGKRVDMHKEGQEEKVKQKDKVPDTQVKSPYISLFLLFITLSLAYLGVRNFLKSTKI